MLFALGAATAALDAVNSLISSGASSSSTSSLHSTGFSTVDPFEIASPASTSSAPASGVGAGSPISPATLNTLLAAQSQSSTGSASTNASDAWHDVSSQLGSDAGSSDSTGAASSYNSLAKMLQQQINAMSFSAPPLSFSV
jgi:hypothetical protein